MNTIYDKIIDQEIWTCYSESLKASKSPKPARNKCYPYVGVKYQAIKELPLDIGATPLTKWNSANNSTSDYLTYPRHYRSLRLKIDDSQPPNTALSKMPEPMPSLPTQEAMYSVFVKKFSSLIFREVSDTLMISNPMVVFLPDPVQSPESEQKEDKVTKVPHDDIMMDPNDLKLDIKGEILSVTCYLEIVPNGGLRITQLWSDGYLGTPPVCP